MHVKKAFCLFLVMVILYSFAATSAFAAYLPKADTSSNNSSNILLVYTGYYNPENYDGEKIGDYNKEKFLPYVGYLDDNGVAQDYFFDTFLMLATTSPYGGSLHRYYTWVPNSTPGTLKDWQWAMDRMFVKGLQLDALNQAVEQVGSQLGNADKKVNVYLTMPFPDPQSTNFGDFNNDGISENLQSFETRKELIRWYIDAMTKRFEEQNYQHLKLCGFYWLQEDLDTTVQGEQESAQYTSEYLNQKLMRLGWIPWSGAGEKANGNRLGFDFSLIQPNHFFDASSTIERVEETADLAYTNDEGVEIEFDGRAVESPYYRQVLYNYLITGVKKEFMNNSLLAYYQDVYAIYDLYHNQSPVGKRLYSDIYKFSKGTFQAPIGNFAGRVVDDSGNPLAGATLKDETGNVVVTNANGEFSMAGLFATKHEFVVENSEYTSRNIKVDIAENQTLHEDVVLVKPAPRKLIDTYSISNFEGGMVYGTNNGYYARRTIETDPNFVYEGNQSLRIDYTALTNNWIRAYVDSDFPDFQDPEHYTAYTLKDWSQYDTVSMAVYNPTDKTQSLSLEFLDQYSWAASYTKNFELAPHKWTILEQSISEMKQAGKNVNNMIRISLLRYNQAEDVTLYVDDVRLNKYEKGPEEKVAQEYVISLPSKVPTMDLQAVWKPTVINKAQKDEQGNPITVDAQLTSSDPQVIEVQPDGTLKAIAVGKAVIRTFVGNIEVLSTVVEVSPWSFNEIKGGNSELTVDPGLQIPYTSEHTEDIKQYVLKNGTNIKIAHKYNKYNDMWLVLDKSGANRLVSLHEWRVATNYNDEVSSDLTRNSIILQGEGSDWIGPYAVTADANGNNNGWDFTGGNHNYGGGNNSATARTVDVKVWADDVEVQDGQTILNNNVKIQVVNHIQGYNTKEPDGSGREILKETITYEIAGGQVQVHNEIEALEDVTISRYYGLQSVNGIWNDQISYYAGEELVGTAQTNVYSDSGSKTLNPDVDRYLISSDDKVKDQNHMLVWLDRDYGLGTLEYAADNWPVIFTYDYGKSYFVQVIDKEAKLSKGEKFYWRGGYNFFASESMAKKIQLKSSFENGYLIPVNEASYQWEIIGDEIVKVDEDQNVLNIKGIRNGKATIRVTMTYNGKSQVFEKEIKVKNHQVEIEP